MENCMLLQYIHHNHTNIEHVYTPHHHTNKYELSHTPNTISHTPHIIRLNTPFIHTHHTDEQSKVLYMHTHHAQQTTRHIETNNNKFNNHIIWHTSHLYITFFITHFCHTTNKRRSKSCFLHGKRHDLYRLENVSKTIDFCHSLGFASEQINLLHNYFFISKTNPFRVLILNDFKSIRAPPYGSKYL